MAAAEAMTQPAAAVAPPPAAPAAPSPQYTPPPAPAPAPAMAEGGDTSGGRGGGFKEFFSDINVVDVTVSAFIVAAVLYSIQYHKYMMMLEKTGYADLSTRVQKVESAIAAAKKKAEANAAGNNSGMRRKRAIMSL